MAINMSLGDSSDCSSPRFSFSKDPPQENQAQEHQQDGVDIVRLDKSLLLDATNYSDEFHFCVTTSDTEKETCPADELFFNGVIIPTQMRDKINAINKECSSSNVVESEEITATTTAILVREEKSLSKSFWRFKRSSSLNCDTTNGAKKGSIWSSLPLLLRSKSTGSSLAPNHKPVMNNSKSMKSSSLSSNSSSLLPSNHQKPPMRKSGYGNGVINGGSYVNNILSARNCHALNVPPPYIAKGTSDLLGLTTLFRNGSKDKRSKR